MARATAQQGTARGNRWFTYLAVGLGLLAAVLVLVTLQDDDGGGGGSSATVQTIVAAQDIAPRTKITASMVRVEAIAADKALRSAFTDQQAVVGLVARYPITAKEQITPAKVGAVAQGQSGRTAGLSSIIPEGKRGVAISVSEQSAVGGLVLAGDRVDIIAVITRELGGIEKATTILQDIEVLSVAQIAQEAVPPPVSSAPAPASTDKEPAPQQPTTLGARPTKTDPQPGARTMTIAVTPEEAQILAVAQDHAKLYLTLRSFGDKEPAALRPADLLPIGALPVAQRPQR